MITQKDIDRINELARKKRETGLTPEETAEREELKKKYVESFRESLVGDLENTYVIGPDGVKRPVVPESKRTKH